LVPGFKIFLKGSFPILQSEGIFCRIGILGTWLDLAVVLDFVRFFSLFFHEFFAGVNRFIHWRSPEKLRFFHFGRTDFSGFYPAIAGAFLSFYFREKLPVYP
jgi:hypothetical protein